MYWTCNGSRTRTLCNGGINNLVKRKKISLIIIHFLYWTNNFHICSRTRTLCNAVIYNLVKRKQISLIAIVFNLLVKKKVFYLHYLLYKLFAHIAPKFLLGFKNSPVIKCLPRRPTGFLFPTTWLPTVHKEQCQSRCRLYWIKS